jgi:cytidylate kinase
MSSKPEKAFNVIFNSLRGKNYLTRYNVTYEIDETGLSIWELCDGSHTVDEIAQAISQEYDISFDQARADCQEFLEDLAAKGLLQ